MQPSNPEKRVLIACPTLGLNPNPNEWLVSLLRIVNQVRSAGFTYATLFPYKLSWWPANNVIFNAAFENKFDYILRLDDDIADVPDEAFQKLVEANKDVVGAAYPSRYYPYKICALNKTQPCDLTEILKEKKVFLQPVLGYGEYSEKVETVDLVGFGMTLIKVDRFKFLERPIFKGPEDVPDDTYFAQLCYEAGIQQYVHLGVRLRHQHVTFANAGHLFNADVTAVNLSEVAA